MLIDGKWRDSKSGKTFATINPATEEVIAEVAEGDAADIDLAVKAARKAFDSGPWRKMDARDRGRLMYKLADLIESHIDELAELETLDNGKPISESRNADLPLVIDCLRYYAGWADKIHGQTIPVRGHYFCYTRREPVGVVGQIIPWNFPMLMVAWKWGPALAAGCTIVMKPAEQTPLSCLRMGELALEAGYPGGRDQHRPRLRRDRRRCPGQAPGRRQDRVHRLDRGRPDHHAERRRHVQAGHPRAGRQEPEHRLRRRRPRLGRQRRDARPVPQPGPVLLRRQPAVGRREGLRRDGRAARGGGREAQARRPVRRRRPSRARRSTRPSSTRCSGYIESGKQEGARCVTGGERFGSKGYFIKPTIFADVKDDMKIATEEIFGPVMQVLKFKDVDEVVQRANTTDYGLAAAVWTRDIKKAHTIAERLRAGTVWINCYDVFDAAAPFGGFKASGIGRELGEKALDNYTELKTVTVALD